VEEEGITFEAGGSFYNPQMRFCRSFSSLVVGTLPGVSVLDAFSATGIRGIRYAKENPEAVASLDFVDMNPEAAALSGKNAKANGIEAEAHEAEFNSFLMGRRYGFLEIDPFGSPAPHIYHAVRSFRSAKGGFLSVTATDTAVLCGAHQGACMRIYHSTPLHDEIFHEAGIRILLKYVSRIANEFNFGIKPLASLSSRHFFKVFLELEKGSEKALRNFRATGYLTLCPSCGHRQGGPMGLESCPLCGKKAKIAGPLWLGELHDPETLERMGALNSQREYAHKKELEKTIALMKGEVGMPPWFYEVHKSCARLGIQPPPKTEGLLALLMAEGFRAGRTHFSPIGIKTDAGICDFGKALKA
jgi:tRNA (guanine26-N2/guanine27-N2)-dimethyltransferase